MLNVLCIAASDPCGGAGIEADIKVLAAHGLNALTAITALTVQDSGGMRSLHPTEVPVFREVLAALEEDQPIAAVKIGALATAAHAAAVADFLARQEPRPPTVLDPALYASSGAVLLAEEGVSLIREALLPLVAVITPNLREAELLTGLSIADVSGLKTAGQSLCRLGAAAALVKGGHLQEDSRDVLCQGGEIVEWKNELLPREFHGTGCALASAIAANLARGLKLPAAVAKAREYLRRCILGARPGKGRAYLLDFPPAS